MRQPRLGSVPAFRYLLAGPAAAGLALLAVVVPGGPASAASGDCAGTTVITCTYTYTGGAQTWTVPAGVDTAQFTLYGAEGASSSTTIAAGNGAEVTGTLPVTPGTTLQVNVGQWGILGAGNGIAFGGGGYGDDGYGAGGGGGGGASDIRDGGYALADRLLVAGGGGGAGVYGGASEVPGGVGGNADSPGAAGGTLGRASCAETLYGGGGGGAGTTAAGGAGGAGGAPATEACDAETGDNGSAGTLGVGGNAGRPGGAGGGGGYYGGGGGGGLAKDDGGNAAGAGGGGGGASYTGAATGASVTDGVAAPDDAGNGEVIITYQAPVIVTATVSGSQAYGSSSPVFTASTAPSGASVSGTASCTTVNGGTVFGASLAAGGYPIDASSCSGLSVPAGYVLTYAGGTFTVNTAAQAISFTAPATGVVNGSAVLTATGGGSGKPVTFSVDPSSGAGVCSVSGTTVSYTAAGNCVIDANQSGNADYSAAPQVTATITVNQAPAFVLDSPATATQAGQEYSYSFLASGTPAPGYALAAGTPSWLAISASTGTVTGTPPPGTTSFTYSVTAANTAGTATAGPFTVTVTLLPPKADISAALSCPATMTAGGTATCTLTVANAGPANAGSVTAALLLPPQLSEIACTAGCTKNGNALTWTLGSLASGAKDQLSLTIKADRAGSALILATAGSRNLDPRPLNNLALTTITIQN
jgi:hypothetical protein